MANEERSRTAEARDGSMEPIMPTANPPGPALFRAPQPPGNGALWTQIRQNLELAAKLLPLVWSMFLFVGGLNFLFYYGSIHFMPELDLKASITVLATSASMGIFLFIMLSVVLVAPALSWLWVINNKILKSRWYDESGKLLRGSTILWFVLPLACFIMASLLMFIIWLWWFVGRQWWGDFFIYVASFVSMGLILFITGWCLWRRLPAHLNSQDKKVAIVSLLSSNFFSMCMFIPLLTFVNMTVKADPEYNTYLTVWTSGVLGFILLWNIILVSAASWPILKFLSVVIATLFIFFLFPPFWRSITKITMNWSRFGNIEHASLILDEVGCNISRNHGLSVEKRVPDPKTCALPDVMILSRLGTPYYIKVDGTPQKRLTIPSQNVLSWSVIEPKNTTSTGLSQIP
jgi:hypothetical protein